jgi:hypothetical protein
MRMQKEAKKEAIRESGGLPLILIRIFYTAFYIERLFLISR